MSGGGYPGSGFGSSASEMPPLVRPPHAPQTAQPDPSPRDEHSVTQPIPFERPDESPVDRPVDRPVASAVEGGVDGPRPGPVHRALVGTFEGDRLGH